MALVWNLPVVSDPDRLLRTFVDDLAGRGAFLDSPRIEAAFRTVPRHRFLPGLTPEEAYRDQVIVTKMEDGVPVSASSQPSFMAVVLQQLDLEPGHRVLEIGSGTGYNAALMAEIVGRQGKVVSVDIDADVAERARAHLFETGHADVTVVSGDGTFGYPPEAPYDRIVVTVGAGDVPPALREQLRPEGRLVVPLSLRGPQRSIGFRRVGDVLVGLSIVDCDLSTAGRGEFAGRTPPLAVGGSGGLWLWWDGARSIDGVTIERLLADGYHEIATGRTATIAEIFGGLYLWVALHDPRFVQLGSAVNSRVPWVLGLPGKLRLTAGLTDETALCLLSTGQLAPATTFADDRLLPLSVRGFGDLALARALVDLIGAWDGAHRPATSDLRVTVYPMERPYSPSRDELVIDKRWSRLVLRW